MDLVARPCVVGLGKLGLPLAAVIAETGLDVIGVDLNPSHISTLNQGKFSSPEPKLNDYLERNRDRLIYTDKFEITSDRNIFFVIVPTPSLPNGAFDDTYLLNAIKSISEIESLEEEITLVVVSTVMPGTCQQKIMPILNDWRERAARKKINLIYSPEFIALGSVIDNLRNPDMTLVGCDSKTSAELFLDVTSRITGGSKDIELLTLTEAEVVKILVNCFVTMKISFANFIGEIAESLPGIDSQKMAQALGMDSRIGGKYLRPGLGFAGPCFPRDNKALITFSASNGLKADLAIATDEINNRQPRNVVRLVTKELALGDKVGVFGVAYKPFTSVTDESQSLKIALLLAEAGYKVSVFDPVVKKLNLRSTSIHETENPVELRDCKVIIVPREFYTQMPSELADLENLLVI